MSRGRPAPTGPSLNREATSRTRTGEAQRFAAAKGAIVVHHVHKKPAKKAKKVTKKSNGIESTLPVKSVKSAIKGMKGFTADTGARRK